MPDPIPYRSPTSSKSKPPITPAKRRHYRYLVTIVSLIVALTTLGDLWTRRLDPSGDLDVLASEFFFLLLTLVALSILSVAWLARFTSYSESWSNRLLALFAVSIPLLLFSIACLLNALEIPFHIAFALSRASLESAVLDYRADPTRPVSPHTVLLPIDTIRTEGPITYVHITGVQPIDYQPMLVWSPTPPAAASIEPLGNNWYWVLQ